MVSLALLHELSDDKVLKGRIRVAFNVVAHEVIKENEQTPYHDLRINSANLMLQWPPDAVVKFVDSVLGSPPVQNSNASNASEISDNEILEGIRSIWNSLIGITPSTPYYMNSSDTEPNDEESASHGH